MDKIHILQARFQGNREGCKELQRWIDERRSELEAKIKQQQQEEEERHGSSG